MAGLARFPCFGVINGYNGAMKAKTIEKPRATPKLPNLRFKLTVYAEVADELTTKTKTFKNLESTIDYLEEQNDYFLAIQSLKAGGETVSFKSMLKRLKLED